VKKSAVDSIQTTLAGTCGGSFFSTVLGEFSAAGGRKRCRFLEVENSLRDEIDWLRFRPNPLRATSRSTWEGTIYDGVWVGAKSRVPHFDGHPAKDPR